MILLPGVLGGTLMLRKLLMRWKVPGTPPSWACCKFVKTYGGKSGKEIEFAVHSIKPAGFFLLFYIPRYFEKDARMCPRNKRHENYFALLSPANYFVKPDAVV